MGVFFKPLRRIIGETKNKFFGYHDIFEILEQFYHDAQSHGFGRFEVCREDVKIVRVLASWEACELEISVREINKQFILLVESADRSYKCHTMLDRVCNYILMRLETDRESAGDSDDEYVDDMPDLE